MKHFGAVANAGASHQMAMCAIGRALKELGHEFLLLGTAYQAGQLRTPDIPFQVIGAGREDPVKQYFECAKQGTLPVSSTVEYMKSMAELLCSELPNVLRDRQIDFVLADQEEPGAATAADIAYLPYASICCSLPLNEAPDIPPGFLPWAYSPSYLAELRNRFAYATRNVVVRGVNQVLNRHRGRANLNSYHKPDDSFSKTVQITQLVKAFDFPRKSPPPNLRYVGPFHRQAVDTVPFPYERLSKSPLIYASFGTSFGNRFEDMRTVAEVCSQLPVQLVVSLGGSQVSHEQPGFPGSTITVQYAPQRELLARAAVGITHAGLNTTMEASSLGVPLLAMPIAGDQFGVSARLRWFGNGLVLNPGHRSAAEVKTAIVSLLENAQFKTAALQLREVIGSSGGASEAAAILNALVVSAP